MLTQSAIQRTILQRMRPDLVVSTSRVGGRTCWSIKDPVTLRYHQLGEEEFTVLQLLDGRHSLQEIQQIVERRFLPKKLEIGQLRDFLLMAQREGLTVVDAPGQAAPLLERKQAAHRQRWFATLSNPLAIRFRGFNPTWLLDTLLPYVAWAFRLPLITLAFMAVISALLLALMSASTIQSRSPEVHEFVQVTNVAWLILTIVTVKCLHELAHGLVCRHFGAECHEAGLMLLVAMPCLYCNVSDSWMLDSKWRRIAIGAAGIAFESTLAATAFFLWWFSSAGIFNSLCFNVMVVCSIGTVLLNGNPLLRFDGYYLLADWLEIPNLWQAAAGEWRRLIKRIYLGADEPNGYRIYRGRRWLLLTYGAASWCYRSVLIVVILWGIFQLAENSGLMLLGQLVVGVVLLSIAGTAVVKMNRALRDPVWRRRVHRRRLQTSLGVSFLLAWAVLWIPLPARVVVPTSVVPRNAAHVHVEAPGLLVSMVSPGDPVEKGATVARLQDPQLELEIADVRRRLRAQQVFVDQLKRRHFAEPHLATSISAAVQLRDALNQELLEYEQLQQKLTLVAPRDGVVIAPRRRPSTAKTDDLPSWENSPLHKENLCSYLELDTELCLIGDRHDLEAVAYVDQAEVSRVRAGQRVKLKFDAMPGERYAGSIVDLELVELGKLPPELMQKRIVAADESGAPTRNAYRAKIAFEQDAYPLRIGSTGWAAVEVEAQSFGTWLWTFLNRTFRFRRDR